MLEQHIEYSKERGTWNLFVNGEWYLEGTYEQCDDAMFNNTLAEYDCYCECDGGSDWYDDEYEPTAEDYHEWVNANCGIDNDAPWLR